MFQLGELGSIKEQDELVPQGGVDNYALVVHPSQILVFAEYALLLPVLSPCWDGCRSSWVRRADEGGTGDTSILIGQKDDTEVAVLDSFKVALDRCHVLRQELVNLFYCHIIQIDRVLG